MRIFLYLVDTGILTLLSILYYCIINVVPVVVIVVVVVEMRLWWVGRSELIWTCGAVFGKITSKASPSEVQPIFIIILNTISERSMAFQDAFLQNIHSL